MVSPSQGEGGWRKLAIISAAKLTAYADYCVRLLMAAEGTDASDFGIGQGIDAADVWGASDEVAAIKAELLSDTNLDSVQAVISHVDKLTQLVKGTTYAANILAPLIGALENHVTRYGIEGVRSLNDYLTYLNTGGGTKWQALMHPRWKDLRPFRAPSTWNCFFAVEQGATYPNALGRLQNGTFTDGAVATAAGGFPTINQSSNLTNSSTPISGTLTITGTAFDPADKKAAPSKTWTSNVNAGVCGVLIEGTAPSDSLIMDVTNITVSVACDGGLIYVEAAPPARASLPS